MPVVASARSSFTTALSTAVFTELRKIGLCVVGLINSGQYLMANFHSSHVRRNCFAFFEQLIAYFTITWKCNENVVNVPR